MKIHMIVCFKLKWSTLLVGIAFLMCLGSFQIRLDVADNLLSLSDKVRAKDRLTRLNPVQRCTTSAAIQSFERCHRETLLITIVVRKLIQQQTLVSLVLEI
jgi:hypothetical protein